MAIRVWRILADLGLLGPKSASVFLTTLFFLRAYQHETFKDQSAMLGEHLSQKLPPVPLCNPIFWPKKPPGGIFANNGLARAHSHAHAYFPWFSVCVDKAMRTENLRMVTAMFGKTGKEHSEPCLLQIWIWQIEDFWWQINRGSIWKWQRYAELNQEKAGKLVPAKKVGTFLVMTKIYLTCDYSLLTIMNSK